MKQNLEAFASKLTELKIPFQKKEQPNADVLLIPFSPAPNTQSLIACFLNTDKADIAFRVMQFVHIPIEKRPQGLEMMNTLNSKYRYGRFVLDDDNDVHLYMDMPAESSPVEEVAMECFVRTSRLLKDSYPDLMRLIYAGTNGGEDHV